jgi:hypothetical protein
MFSKLQNTESRDLKTLPQIPHFSIGFWQFEQTIRFWIFALYS